MDHNSYKEFATGVRGLVEQLLQKCERGNEDIVRARSVQADPGDQHLEITRLREIEGKYRHKESLVQQLKQKLNEKRADYNAELAKAQSELEREIQLRRTAEQEAAQLRMELAKIKAADPSRISEEFALKELSESQLNTQSTETTPHHDRARYHPSKSSTILETPTNQRIIQAWRNENDDAEGGAGTALSPIKIKAEPASSLPLPEEDSFYYDAEPQENAATNIQPKNEFITPKDSTSKKPARFNMLHEVDGDFYNKNHKFLTSKESLQTPCSEEPVKKKQKTNAKIDNFFRSSSKSSTPSKGAAASSPSPEEREILSMEELRTYPWEPEDFIINPKYNDGYDYAYKETVRGEKRKCIHGTNCKQCEQFYKIAGPGAKSAGPAWSGENKDGETVDVPTVASRHRHKYPAHDSPEGFWKSHMPGSQEISEERRINAERNRVKSLERLEEAFKCGRYLFRDPTYRQYAEEGRLKPQLDAAPSYA